MAGISWWALAYRIVLQGTAKKRAAPEPPVMQEKKWNQTPWVQ